jgi:hypothetical protein
LQSLPKQAFQLSPIPPSVRPTRRLDAFFFLMDLSSLLAGDIGVSPAAASSLTGFALTLGSDGTYATSTQVTGKVYAADYANPTPPYLTTAVSNMQAAYTDASGRANPDFTNLAGGQ